MSFIGRILIGFFYLFQICRPLHPHIPCFFFFFFKKKGLISDLMKNKYKLPRSYLLAPIATLFFISQLILATVGNITQLWIASLLLGLAHGSLYSLYPTLCLEWFGMGTYHPPPSLSLLKNPLSSGSFVSTAHFSENWGYLGISLLVGGNVFSLVFGQNLDAHDRPLTTLTTTTTTIASHLHDGPPAHPPSIVVDPVQCLKGLDCYVSAIYLTLSATLVSIVLCVWAGYREKQRNTKLLK